jgi:hypothetical protein
MTPQNAPYKQKQRELEQRRKVVWLSPQQRDNFMTADGTKYERKGNTLVKVGRADYQEKQAELKHRMEAKEAFLKGKQI